jgi:proteasome lid subunit RPN8/RPN11
MRFARDVVEDIQAHAREGYPFEVCGLLLRASAGAPTRIVASRRMTNHEAELPRVRYVIDALEQLRADDEARGRGLEIAGYYHSHPDHPARPSETDRRIAAGGLSDGVLHVVVGVQGGRDTEPTAWIFHDAGEAFEAEPFEVD